ncbi:hypothetical protein ACLEIY_19070 [Acetobacter tropicalis]|uniref:hypothetical protein n=1 Tax=Acetobacter tropicalis TaxID=104102 RepID=UPI003976D4D9
MRNYSNFIPVSDKKNDILDIYSKASHKEILDNFPDNSHMNYFINSSMYEKHQLSEFEIIALRNIQKKLHGISIKDFSDLIISYFPDNKKIESMLIGFLSSSECYSNNEKSQDYIYKIFTLVKIIPFIDKFNVEFYFDERDDSFVAVIYGDGTLKIKVKKRNIFDFFYAAKADSDNMVSSQGYFKITSVVENSRFFSKILRIAI